MLVLCNGELIGTVIKRSANSVTVLHNNGIKQRYFLDQVSPINVDYDRHNNKVPMILQKRKKDG